MQLANLRGLVVAAITISLTAVGCTSATSGVGTATTSPPHKGVTPAAALQLAGPWSTTYAYTLTDLSSCHITDALTVIENQLADPVHLTSVRLSVVDDSLGRERISAAVTAYKAGTTTGAVGAASTLSPLRNHRLLPAVGAILVPFSRSSAWYEVVLHIDVLGAHPNQWSIDGISVGYTVGNQKFTTTFPQSVKLAAVRACPA
jgi:hypothetical protein